MQLVFNCPVFAHCVSKAFRIFTEDRKYRVFVLVFPSLVTVAVAVPNQRKNSLTAILDMTYPGANEPFTSPARRDGTQKRVDFVRTFWHMDCVRGISPAAFTERCQKWRRKNKYNFSSGKAAQIYAGAQDRIAMMPKDNLTKMIVRQPVDSLTAVSGAAEQLRAETLLPLLPALTPEQINPALTRQSVPASPNAARRSCAGRCSWLWTVS